MPEDVLVFPRARFERLLEILEDMAGGGPLSQVPISGSQDELDAVAHGINVMAGELHFRLKDLQSTQSHLVQSGKLAALGEVCSGLAHELNNPLAIIRGYVEQAKGVAEAGDRSDALGKCLERIDANVDRMDAIIRHVMDFSRQTPQERRPVPLPEVVGKAFILLNEQLRLRNIRVERDFGDRELVAWGDEQRLEQVLINLLTNARDAIVEKGSELGGNIRVRTRACTPSEVEITVEDDGIGMSEEVRGHLFTPFFTTKGVGKGTGLGLSISLGIIQEHRGVIDCESAPGKGTVFSVRLPRWSEDK